MKKSDTLRCVRALQETGLRVDVVEDDAHDFAAADYSCLALPAHLAANGSQAAEQNLHGMIQTMHDSGKPVLYLPVPEPPWDAAQAAPAFSMRILFAESWKNWNSNDAPRLGAALAYYTLLSLAPLLVLVVSVAELFFKQKMVRSGLVWQVQEFMGNAGATIVASVLQNSRLSAGILAGTVGVAMLLIGASGVFLELRDSLNTVWGVKAPYSTGWNSLLRARASAVLSVLGAGVILMLFFVASTVLSTPARFVVGILPFAGVWTAVLLIALSVVPMTLVFALIYKTIPDVKLLWGDVWIGALVTAVLYTIGKAIIGIYLETAGIGSPYAAAGSLVLFLVWMYYSAQIFLFGAEFTHAYARRHGSHSASHRHRRGR